MRNSPEIEVEADESSEESEEDRTTASVGAEIAVGAEAVGGIWEVPRPPGERRTSE